MRTPPFLHRWLSKEIGEMRREEEMRIIGEIVGARKTVC